MEVVLLVFCFVLFNFICLDCCIAFRSVVGSNASLASDSTLVWCQGASALSLD